MTGWYNAGEMARRLGVSVKALRVYEQAGLVTPDRTAAGYRIYGPAHAERLHQVLALKRLGLPLRKMATLLNGRFASLDAVLALQEQVLEARITEAARGLRLIAAARKRLAQGGALGPDDLARLTRETTMNDEHRTLEAALRPHIETHFSAEERARLAAAAAPFDQDEVSREWAALIAEAKTLMAQGDPNTPAAQDLARRWAAQVARFTQGKTDVAAKVTAVWQGAMADPNAAAALPITPDLMQFMGEAMRVGGNE